MVVFESLELIIFIIVFLLVSDQFFQFSLFQKEKILPQQFRNNFNNLEDIK